VNGGELAGITPQDTNGIWLAAFCMSESYSRQEQSKACGTKNARIGGSRRLEKLKF
jgi:hypothetical protein